MFGPSGIRGPVGTEVTAALALFGSDAQTPETGEMATELLMAAWQ